jgi:hypothetical protein
MTAAAPAGLRILQEGGRDDRGGNLLLLDETPGREALLKVYRRRGSRGREAWKQLSYQLIERKRGVTARGRCVVERANLALWRAEGFDVPALLDRPLPVGFAPDTAQWMEYCPGPLLHELVRDRSLSPDARAEEVARFGRDLARRQARAIATDEPALVMKHASIKHVLLHAGRQVSFDLESRYAPGVAILDALADELGGYLRSLFRVLRPAEREQFGGRFLESYGQPAQLAAIVGFGLREGGVSRALRRLVDRRRRLDFSEYDALQWLEARLGA